MKSKTRPFLRDDDGVPTRAGDLVTFSYGMPPIRAIGRIINQKGRLLVSTPGCNTERGCLRSLRHYVGEWYRLERVEEQKRETAGL